MRGSRATRVLVIEDDPGTRAIVLIALRRAGFDALEAQSGEEGLELISSSPVDVVVCDLGMPGISGIDVIRRLRGSPETATLPILVMTGSGNHGTVIEALEAGATDFLAKPVRLDELVARVRAHVRTQAAWDQVVQYELAARASVVAALGGIAATAEPNEIAARVVALFGERMNATFCSILTVQTGSRLTAVATWDRVNGVVRRRSPLASARARDLLEQAAEGAWVDYRPERPPDEADSTFWDISPRLVARSPVYAGERLVAILALGGDADDEHERSERGRLLASVIDLGSVLGALVGAALADHTAARSERTRLRRILSQHQFQTVYQPLVEMSDNRVAGWEALTRFADGTPPDVRFAEARVNGLGAEFEMAAIEAGIANSVSLPADGMLTVNVSPEVLLSSRRRLARLLDQRGSREVILELSEHSAIADYPAIRAATAALGTKIAIDDAGAGYSSLRHLLELKPNLAKLDISLVRGIHADPVRQALVAGLSFYAQQSGCRLVAEGVEEESERDTLIVLGVELAQGYLFGRPLPIETVRRE